MPLEIGWAFTGRKLSKLEDSLIYIVSRLSSSMDCRRGLVSCDDVFPNLWTLPIKFHTRVHITGQVSGSRLIAAFECTLA